MWTATSTGSAGQAVREAKAWPLLLLPRVSAEGWRRLSMGFRSGWIGAATRRMNSALANSLLYRPAVVRAVVARAGRLKRHGPAAGLRRADAVKGAAGELRARKCPRAGIAAAVAAAGMQRLPKAAIHAAATVQARQEAARPAAARPNQESAAATALLRQEGKANQAAVQVELEAPQVEPEAGARVAISEAHQKVPQAAAIAQM